MDMSLIGFLALSRLGRQKLAFYQLDKNNVIREALDTFEFEIDKNEVSIEVTNCRFAKETPCKSISCFSIFIGNSLKFFHQERKVKIKILGQKQNEMSKYVVEDNGIGISESCEKKVFELFQRLNP